MGSIPILYYNKTSVVWVKFVSSLSSLRSTSDFGAVAGDGNGVIYKQDSHEANSSQLVLSRISTLFAELI